jgi:hypothetical protein
VDAATPAGENGVENDLLGHEIFRRP